MTQTPAIELCDVTKDFWIGLRGIRLRAVSNLSLSISPGQIFGLLGPNGSGKSTTIKIILGLLTPTYGKCALFGVSSELAEARQSLGYLPESPDFYPHLSGVELVSFYGRMCGLAGAHLRSRVEETIALVGLSHASERRVGTYSKGMLQRIGLAQAMVHDPALLILDEPTAGVDLVASDAIGELLLTLKSAGKTILITSHLLGQVEDWCDRVAIMDRGQVIAEGRVSELTRSTVPDGLSIELLPDLEGAELDQWLAARGHSTTSVAPRNCRLADFFRRQVGVVSSGKPSRAHVAPVPTTTALGGGGE
ncbi:MAG: ABC transporter ATP-binding protein [Opitutus sp.]